MTSKRFLQRLAAPVTLATVMMGGIMAVAPSSAMADSRDCPGNYVCVWGDTNYTGRFIFQPGGQDHPDIGSSMNDLTSSLWNRSGSRVCFYADTNYHGSLLLIVTAGGSRANVGSTANDKISSWRKC